MSDRAATDVSPHDTQDPQDVALALVLFLEGDAPHGTQRSGVAGAASAAAAGSDPAQALPEAMQTPRKAWYERALDKLVATMQPEPKVVHAELLLVAPDAGCWHFATYLGDQAAWRDHDHAYYQEHAWRALPLDGGGAAVQRLAQQCDAAQGTPYALSRYPFATRMLGFAAPALSDEMGAPAQCAALVARLVHTALGARGRAMLPLHGPRYSPSLLHNDLCANASSVTLGAVEPVAGVGALENGGDPVGAIDAIDATRRDGPEDHEAVGLLLNGTQEQVDSVGRVRRALGLKALARRAHSHLIARAAIDAPPDPYELRTLAWAALRVASMADAKREQDLHQGDAYM